MTSGVSGVPCGPASYGGGDATARSFCATDEPREQPLLPLKDVERRHIERVLDEVRWDRRRAAKILGLSRWSLARRLRKYAMQRPGTRLRRSPTTSRRERDEPR